MLGGVLLAQNPVSIYQVGTTPVTTTIPVSGIFWQATQPMSATALPLPTGASTLAEQQTQTTSLQLIDNAISGAGFNITQLGGVNVSMNTGVRDAGTQRVTIATNDVVPVTGTFWQATQPVSGTFWQATQPVSGTFWQATQPVSLASMPSTPVTGTFWQATQPVSGTFWQATQPVSIASMPSTPVTGTFWQATQPVSGTVTANAGTNLNTSALALEATQLTGNTSIASVKTNTDPLVAAGAGGYVRQDSTATIAKETGGNLATIATQTKVRGTASGPTMVMATDIETTLLASNAARVGWRVCNRSASPLLVKFGSLAATNSFNVRVEPNTCYSDSSYTGQVNGLWFVGADQYAMVSEST